MVRVSAVVLCFSLAACAAAPVARPARTGTNVTASAGKTWDSVIETFADRNISIATMERASGFIAASPERLGTNAGGLADCGKMMGTAITPNTATYNVLVRGDSSSSNVKVTVKYTADGGKYTPAQTCPSTGQFEDAVESAIKSRAEAKR